MKCPRCGFANQAEAKFCRECGQNLDNTPICPACGAAGREGASFCPRCGNSLSTPSSDLPEGVDEDRQRPLDEQPPEDKRRPYPSPPAEVHIEGGVSGQVAIGDNIIQIGNIYGGEVNIGTPEEMPKPQPRPTPISLIPRPFPGLLDREGEVDTVTTILHSALQTPPITSPVEFYAQAGMGKTSLLRHLAHRSAADAFTDGVVYLAARSQPTEDILQFLYDAFYESGSFKPTQGQIRQSLQGKRALFILDDVELARDEVEVLMNAAPTCTFLLGSPERRLWGEGKAIGLSGLPPEAALELLEQELDRSLTPSEQSSGQALCAALEGHPLRILQAAATAREKGLSLTEAARQIQTSSPAATLTAQMLTSLSKQEQQALAAMAALGDAPTHADHLAKITGLPNVLPTLETLQQRGLAQAHSPQYSLTGDMTQTLQREWDLAPWAERALAHFTAWAEGQQQAPDHLLEEAAALLQVLEQAVQAKQWKSVLRLGRAIEGALAVGKRWGAWAQVLRWILQAAQALGKQSVQAWALHQLGSRALCLEDASAARTALTKALRMREALGDEAGAALTRHNLRLLLAPPTPPKKKPPQKPPQPPTTSAVSLLVKGSIALLTTISLLALGGGGIWYFFLRPTPTPTPVEATARPEPTNPPPTEFIAPETPPPTEFITPETPPPTEPPPVEESWINIELADGCFQEYERGDYTILRVETNIEGRVELWLDDSIIDEEIALAPGDVREIEWAFESVEPGEHAFWGILFDTDGDEAAEAECPFAMVSPPTLTPSPTPDVEGPKAPLLLNPKSGAEISCPTGNPVDITLRWEAATDPSGIAQYNIELVEHPSYPPTPIASRLQIDGNQSQTSISGECGSNYDWWVQAVDSTGNVGEWSLARNFRVLTVQESDTTPPGAPDPIGIGDPNLEQATDAYPCNEVILSWNPATDYQSGVSDYQISLQRLEGNEWQRIQPYSLIYETSTDVGQWTDIGYNYRWQVWARDRANNQGDASDWLYFACPIY